MKIYLAADHAGFELKEQIKSYLQEKGYEVEQYLEYYHKIRPHISLGMRPPLED